MLWRMQVPLQMNYSWLMITQVLIGVTRQMNFLIKTGVMKCNGHQKVKIFNQSCECSYERPQIVTHRHTLVDQANGCGRVAKLVAVLNTDFFGPWAHMYRNVFNTKVAKSILETLLFWAVSISTHTCYRSQWRFTWNWNYCEFLLKPYCDSQVTQFLPTQPYTADTCIYWKINHRNIVALNLLTSVVKQTLIYQSLVTGNKAKDRWLKHDGI